MILLQCPICRNYMAADAKEVMASETILCPHCHRESDKEEVLNQKKETKTHEKFLKEIKSFVNEIDTIDVNDKIGQLYRNYRISPIISTYFVNCLLENCHTEDFPPLFAKLEEPENVHLSSYIEELERQISQTHDYLPEISMLAHTSGAKELAYQKK